MNEKKFVRSGPHLPVRNLRETLEYYRDTLGFYDEWTSGTRDGGVRRDELRLLFNENPDHVGLINTEMNRFPLLWFVENIEEVYNEFKGRRIDIQDSLRLHPYGMLEFAFIDISGYYIRVAEQMHD